MLLRVWPTAFLLLLLTWFQVQLWTGRGSLPSVWQLRTELGQKQQRNEQLATEIAQLQAQIKDLNEGQVIVEERARASLLMLKPNEIFVQTRQ